MMGVTLPIIIFELVTLANDLVFTVGESGSGILRVLPSADVLRGGGALTPAPPLPCYIAE